MLDSKTILAPAKLNIFLKVLNKRIDEYHSLRTGITFIDLFDKIDIKKTQKIIQQDYTPTRSFSKEDLKVFVKHFVEA